MIYTTRGNALSGVNLCSFCRGKGEKNYHLWYKSMLRNIKETYVVRMYSCKCTLKMNLYTSKKPKTPQYVDNMVDNVDNPLWISLTVFVHTCVGGCVLTCGKSLFREADLQEILPDFVANLCSDADKNRFFTEFRRNRKE